MTATSKPLWGKMNAAQMVAHCRKGLEMAMGDVRPKRHPLGRLLGAAIKKKAFRGEEPMRRNSPTLKELVMRDGLVFEEERERLRQAIGRFAGAGASGCTEHPHAFFGKLTPEEWSMWMYKHLDHHLQQFGV